GNRKARLLLKVLAARRPHTPMDVIVDALWGESPPVKAIENVASLVSRLRTALATDVVQGGRAGYRLVLPPGCTVDVDEEEALVAGGLEEEARRATIVA